MYQVRKLGKLTLELLEPLSAQFSFADFCEPAGTIDFKCDDGFLQNKYLRLFRLSFPGYELEATIAEGRVFVRRNGLYQHSDAYLGAERCAVAIQWDTDSVACGVQPPGVDSMDTCMRAVRTPHTLPPRELVHLLRTESLVSNAAYRSEGELYATVLDCLHLCELDIRRHGSESFVWTKSTDVFLPMAEPQISKFLAGYLTSHGASRNFDVTCEPLVGTGNLDFHIVAPILNGPIARVAIEAKKADSAQLIPGFQTQLPEYMRRLGTAYGIFLVYWLKSSNYPHPSQATYAELEIQRLHPLPRPPTIRSVCVDFSFGPTPSKM